MDKTCLLLKPHATTAESREHREQQIKDVFRPAISAAKLTVIGDEMGVEVEDITSALIQLTYEAKIIVVDANCYESAGAFTLSPYLYYLIGLSHSLGNNTILVAKSINHLPHSLNTSHTLTYARVGEFFDQFQEVVNTIISDEDKRPKNPVQEYLQERDYRKTEQDLAKAKAELSAKKAELEELTKQQADRKKSPNITFRRVQ
jgi:hypothetical protein